MPASKTLVSGQGAIAGQQEPWLWGGASHPGGRSEQQDRWGVFIPPDRRGLLAVVADGLGGHQDGALGAQAIVDVTGRFIQEQADRLHARRPKR